MKNILSKILMGISALVVAGIVSVIPYNKAQASYAPVNTIDVATPGQPTPLNGTVNITYSGTGSTQFLGSNMRIHIPPHTPQPEVSIEVVFYDDLPASATCNYEFSFMYNGVSYYGNIGLMHDNDSNYFHLPGHHVPLSNFIDTRNLENAAAFSRSINTKIDEIEKAVQGLNADGTVNETKTVEYNYNYAINEKIIEKLAQADGVTLLYTFEYEGYVFTSTITSEDAAKIFSKDIPWYGPCYIASNCPTVMVGVAV